MNLLNRIRQHKLVAGTITAVAAIVAVALPVALHASVTRDTSSNSVINGGAVSIQELTNKVANGDGSNSGANIQAIYSQFGISSSTFSTLSEGVVTQSGDVIVGGKTVATDVWTAGRERISANDVAMGSVFMRPPSVSFRSSAIEAYVDMHGGTFHYAVLKSCGNPVYSIKKPFGQIYKRVVTADGVSHAADDAATAVAFNSGDTFKYVITVTNNGTDTMNNVVVTDTLPAGIELVSNPSKRDFTIGLGSIAAGASKDYTLTVRLTATQGTITNKACFTADSNQTGCDVAVVITNHPTPTPTVTPTPTPTVTPTPTSMFACGGLTKEQVGDQNSLTYKFTATPQLTNIDASTVSYTFHVKDANGNEIKVLHTNVNTFTFTFPVAGDYRVFADVITPQGTAPLVDACGVSFHAGPSNVCQTNPNANGCGGNVCATNPSASGCVATPPTTPRTGAEGLAGMGGLGAIGYGVREYIRSKKSLLSALKR